MFYALALFLLAVVLCYVQLRTSNKLLTLNPEKEIQNIYFHIAFAVIISAEVILLNKIDFFKISKGHFVLGLQSWPLLVQACLALLFFDFLSYFWHKLNHETYWLWELHKFHHRSTTIDAFMAYRFHPVEIFLGYHFRAFFIWLIGFSPSAIAFFVFIYGVLNLIQHSNVKWPDSAERALSSIFITPRLHHMHHSIDEKEQSSNYGTIFSFWDRLFLTYKRPRPSEDIQLGLKY